MSYAYEPIELIVTEEEAATLVILAGYVELESISVFQWHVEACKS